MQYLLFRVWIVIILQVSWLIVTPRRHQSHRRPSIRSFPVRSVALVQGIGRMSIGKLCPHNPVFAQPVDATATKLSRKLGPALSKLVDTLCIEGRLKPQEILSVVPE
ncbi:unnamed protein product [Rhizoctonia solani]|uniref:Uncharacterized protein n=1 Tax=Rhizoctonia solani TaxID=456999 RepID=A0A8H3A1S0_9AGAM|nr:unnamed protein product [Rhizoctonia solani]